MLECEARGARVDVRKSNERLNLAGGSSKHLERSLHTPHGCAGEHEVNPVHLDFGIDIELSYNSRSMLDCRSTVRAVRRKRMRRLIGTSRYRHVAEGCCHELEACVCFLGASEGGPAGGGNGGFENAAEATGIL